MALALVISVFFGILFNGVAEAEVSKKSTSIIVQATYDSKAYYQGINLPVLNPIYKGEFEGFFNKHFITKHTPHHNGYDEVWRSDDVQSVRGKFQYGDIRKDLEGEWISVYVYNLTTGGNWTFIQRQKTDKDGRIDVQVPEHLRLEPGKYVVRLYVEGDGSYVNTYIKVMSVQENFVVFDIDGTLTLSDGEVTREYIDEYFFEDYKAKAYEGAVQVVNYYKNRGYNIIYLTARPYWLSDISSKWLIEKGFPIGTVHTREEAVPKESGDVYKRNYLNSLKEKHVAIHAAYGNAMTDIYAYKAVGISLDKIYIIGENAGKDGTTPVSNYPEHLNQLKAEEL